jgi:hypothetical protein
MNRNIIWKIVLILAVLAVFTVAIIPTKNNPEPIKRGLDLKGGTHLVMRVNINEASRLDVDQAMELLKSQAAKNNLPVPVTQVDNVAAGDLAVAVSTPEGSDKESFFYFELATVEPDVSVTKATLTLPLSETAGSEQIAPDPVKVTAAEPDDRGFGDVDAEDYAAKPAIPPDGLRAPAKASADSKSYEFDVTAFATKWVTGDNNGMLVPLRGARSDNARDHITNARNISVLALVRGPLNVSH